MTPFHPRARRTNNCTSAIHIRRSRMRQKGDETSLTQKPQNPQNPHLPRARRVTVHLTRLIPPWQYLMRERIRLPTVSRLLQCFWLWIRTFKSYRCASSLPKELVLYLQDVGDVGFFLFLLSLFSPIPNRKALFDRELRLYAYGCRDA